MDSPDKWKRQRKNYVNLKKNQYKLTHYAESRYKKIENKWLESQRYVR